MAYPAQPEPAVEEWSAEELGRRRGAVRAAMQHAWAGYERYAWGRDELCPLTKSGKDSFGGLGATMVDALDTLHMMGLGEEYERAAEWVRTQMPVNASFDASVFESIIRVVGGTLAAYDLTGDKRMLERAQEVAHRLLPAYATPSGIPLNIVNLATMEAKNPAWNHKASTLAEFGTHQLEFWRLSQATGNATYTDLAEATIRHLHTHWPKTGLMPLFISPQTGNFTSRRVSLGALGDSYYEYLLKMWIVKGKGDEMYRQMWERAMDDMIEKLVMVSKDGLTYIAEYDRTIKHKFDHLVCFVPGMLALGAHSGAVQGQKAERYLQLAGELTNTCWQMYHRMPCGLSPEYVNFGPSGMRPGAAFNLLRPEALEAMWYMWRLTHDWRYRTWGWHIFQAFEKHCKVEAGYAGLKDVRLAEPKRDDTMQSFFLAETLKYLWLLFSEDDAFNMDEWVLNTEAHPLRASPPAREGQHAPGEATGKRWWWPPAKGGGSGGGGGGGLLAGGGGSDAGGATDGTAQQRR
ncbi:Mannosyl-oligosaccharide 1,2-alpha-mannosidase MNS1 [Micractinium conductrix]|uniref:alpha-1,2-Mannosidase n=1 Tax=Micractinium conductrix TaxID=554055 RepID=A0A2P6VIR6_9CHLO|nr:Mannosyl-oligosaccharide 1,2-alpha-mannosidase MNS1 [Micractinium conductrix]|eukprot:PSC73991.1 Mannosyl-oligosaccharide 1,2-alpha-mannosidase MNS1 [Micractinium conductrix]